MDKSYSEGRFASIENSFASAKENLFRNFGNLFSKLYSKKVFVVRSVLQYGPGEHRVVEKNIPCTYLVVKC